jgi:MFS family permease
MPRTYWKLWFATAISNLGNGVSIVAYPWIASSITRSPLTLSIIGLMGTLPWLFFSLPAGVITDRVDRRKLIISMDVMRGVITAGVAIAVWSSSTKFTLIHDVSKITVVHSNTLLLTLLMLAAFLLGCGEVLGNNASQTFIPKIVPTEKLQDANGKLWVAESLTSNFVGPPLAAFLLGISVIIPFIFDAASFFFSAGLVLLIVGNFKSSDSNGKVAPATFRKDLSEGLTWLWRHKFLRPLAFTLGALNFQTSLGFSVLILFAQEILKTNVFTFGLLSTGAAVGGTIGGIFGPRISARLGRGRTVQIALIGFPSIALIGGLISSWQIAWLLFGLESFIGIVWNVVTVSLRQEIIPDQLLGRVNSVYRFFALGTMPLGAILGGLVVTLNQHFMNRQWALRSPLLLSALLGIFTCIYAIPKLTTAKIEAARTEAAAK